MQFLLNELSVHGQYNSATEFFSSVDTVMEIRQVIRREGRELYCHRQLAYAKVTTDAMMQQIVQSMPHDKRQAWTQWLSRLGPYWIDEREHPEDAWLELSNNVLVTDTSIGEAAYCKIRGIDRELLSLQPSNWMMSNISVSLHQEKYPPIAVEVKNHWTKLTVVETLRNLAPPFYSWRTLDEYARRCCEKLTFTDNAFHPLIGTPYSQGVADRLMTLLRVLNKMCECFDENDARTTEGHQLYADHFTGKKAWFSDSSDTEKSEFNAELTFPHPKYPDKSLFCTWHGKVKTPQLRIHFSWPILVNNPVYVVYVGPKITKR